MRLQKKSNFRSFDVNKDGTIDMDKARIFGQYMTNMDSDLVRIFDLSNSGISFGPTVNLSPGENMFGQWATVADTGTADTEFAVPHTFSSQSIGIVPGNYFVTYTNKKGVVYDSGTPWTTSNIYLKCSAANARLNIFLTR